MAWPPRFVYTLGTLIRQQQIAELDAAARAFDLSIPESVPVEPPAKGAPGRPSQFKDLVLVLLQDKYPGYMRAIDIQSQAERLLGRTFHPKTAGMTLYRLSQDHLVRREGDKWFFVPPEERTKEKTSEAEAAEVSS